MPTDRLNRRDFDEMLGRALRSSSQPVPADFTEKMLKRIRQSEEQKVLARVVLQERLALAGCIALVAAAVLAGLVFPDNAAEFLHRAAGAFTQQGRDFVDGIPQTIEAIRGQWQWCLALGAAAVLAFYSLAGLWLGERLKTA